MNLDNFMKECKENPISLTLQKTVSLGNGSYKILCETSKKNPQAKEVRKAISKLFNNKVSVIESTIQDKGSSLVSMVVKANIRSIPYKEGNLPEGKKMITASICADVNDDSIWEVQGTGSDKRLVLKAEDNFEKIFEHNNRICTASLVNFNTAVQSGDYISYYNSKANTIKSGYAFIAEDESLVVVDRDLEEETIQPEEVIESADLTDLNMNPYIQASLDAEGSSKIKEYMKILFKNTDFYNKLDSLMNVRRSEGTDGKFTTTMVTAGYEDNMDQIKEEIKEFLINDSIDELRDEVLNTNIEIFDEKEGNSEGDIDFATEEEIESYADDEAKGDAGEIEDIVSSEDEVDNEITFDMSEGNDDEEAKEVTVENLSNDLLNEEDITVTTEAELDDGEFEDVNIEEFDEEDLDSKLSDILGE